MSSFIGEKKYEHGSPDKTGILLTNLGTPDAPTSKALKPYLKEFLSDPRVIELPKLISTDGKSCSYVNYIGYSLIDYIEIHIGGTKIDRLTGEWMYIYNELSIKEQKIVEVREIIDFISLNQKRGISKYLDD